MERFSNTTREVAQSGRRGALMITIDVNHPDVEKFAVVKHDLKKVTGANISIKMSDEFMNAVKNNENYTLKFPVNSKNPTVTRVIKAKDLWNIIVSSARNNAEAHALLREFGVPFKKEEDDKKGSKKDEIISTVAKKDTKDSKK